MDENPENRHNARIKYRAPVMIENLKAGIIYQARMLNYSKHGLYFETDSWLNLGDEVFIGIEYSPYSDSHDTYECLRSKILWRKKLPTSHFKYGYGVQYCIDYDKQKSRDRRLKIVDDQRKHTRKRYIQDLLFSAQNKILKGLAKNISPCGVFIETHHRLDAGFIVTLVVPLKEGRTAKIKGEVIWSSPNGFGVNFISIKK